MNPHVPTKTDPPVPKTDDVAGEYPLHGADRSGLGDKGWAETPEDRIGGHPELEADEHAKDQDAG